MAVQGGGQAEQVPGPEGMAIDELAIHDWLQSSHAQAGAGLARSVHEKGNVRRRQHGGPFWRGLLAQQHAYALAPALGDGFGNPPARAVVTAQNVAVAGN